MVWFRLYTQRLDRCNVGRLVIDLDVKKTSRCSMYDSRGVFFVSYSIFVRLKAQLHLFLSRHYAKAFPAVSIKVLYRGAEKARTIN